MEEESQCTIKECQKCRNYLYVKKLYDEQSVFRGPTGIPPPPRILV
jgi:hypothetical protein